jgi:folylpolyglutamate synthase/dihydropteroate synthase
MAPEALAARWAHLAPATRPEVRPGIAAAIERAIGAAPGPIVVAGSLYLVGAVRALLVRDPELLDPVPSPEPPTR